MRKDVRFERSDMHDYQEKAKAFIDRHPASGIFIDLGLGKTVISGTAALDSVVTGEVDKVLIIGPKRVASVGWPNEFSEWGHLCFYHMSVIDGTKAQRMRALETDCHFYTVSVDNVAWLVDHYKTKWPFDMVILDESSLFKSHSSQRFKMLRRVRKYMKKFVELTATPAAEGYMGLFAQVYLLDNGDRFGQDISGYQEQYFTQNRYTYRWKLRPGAEKEIVEKISDICLVMKAEDYLDKKGIKFVPVPVKLGTHESQLYRQLEEESVVEFMPDILDPDLDNPVVIEAEQAASLQSKLLQLASGFIYDTKIVGVTDDDKVIKRKDAYQIHDHKFEKLQELLDSSLEGENVIIVYHFKPTLARLKERFKGLETMDAAGKNIKRWNDGKIRLLALHPQSAGHGLNLQRGGHIFVYVDHPWSLERFLQLNGRLDRQGQKKPVIVIQLESKIETPSGELTDTVDRTVIEALNEKRDIQEEFFRLLERIKGRIRRRIKTKNQGLWDDEN